MARPVLQFVGSCRNQFDEDRLQKLQDKALELKIDGDLQFYKNVMYMLASTRALHSTGLGETLGRFCGRNAFFGR